MATNDAPALAATPMALIGAAEVLMGKYGIEGISLRRIYAEARINNKSAVAYHFGDKTALVKAIWDYRLPALERMRRAMMDEMQQAGRMGSPAIWVDLLLRPLFELTDNQGRRTYAGFFRQALRSPALVQLRNEAAPRTPASSQLFGLLTAAATIAPDELALRFRVLCCAFCDLIVERDAAIAGGLPVKTEADFMRDAVAMVLGGCSL